MMLHFETIGDVSWVSFVPFGLGGLAFFATWIGVHFYYRNAGKRYNFERETDVRVSGLQQFDVKTRSMSELQNRFLLDRNDGSPRARVRRIAVTEAGQSETPQS